MVKGIILHGTLITKGLIESRFKYYLIG